MKLVLNYKFFRQNLTKLIKYLFILLSFQEKRNQSILWRLGKLKRNTLCFTEIVIVLSVILLLITIEGYLKILNLIKKSH